MSRSVKDLREIINVSRLSYRDDEEEDELCSASNSTQDFGGIPLEASQPTLPKRSKDLTPLCTKGKHVSPPVSAGSAERQSPLPPIGLTHNISSNSSPSSSGRNSPAANHLTMNGDRVIPACKKDVKPSKTNFDNILHYMDSTVVGDWLTKANDALKQLSSWLHHDDNFVQFAHFWLSKMPTSKQRQLIDMEFSIFMDELGFAFDAGLKEGSVTRTDIDTFAHALIWEYPEKLNSSETRDYFLNILLCLCSGKRNNYHALLSDVQCSTLIKQFVQIILATRAFAIVNICSGVLEFYKAALPKSSKTESMCNSLVSQSLVAISTEFAFQTVQKELPDVFDFLIRSYSLQYQTMKDSEGKSLIFTAVHSGKEVMLAHLLKMNPRMDVNEKVPSGNTALHAAVNIGSVSMVKLLINAGANVNAWNADCEGATPLHLAVMGGNSEMVSALLEAGCDTNVKMGIPATITPLSLAKELELEDIIHLLSKSSLT